MTYGKVRYQLPPYRDGTTHVIFEPFDFITHLAALVHKPRVSLTRFHSVCEVENNMSFDYAFKRADKNNYQAKASGKNKIIG